MSLTLISHQPCPTYHSDYLNLEDAYDEDTTVQSWCYI